MAEACTGGFYRKAQALLENRLDEKRYGHSLQVSHVAGEIAEAYGVDADKARIAGLLHDWDKGLDNAEVRRRVKELGISVDPFVYNHMPWLLHGITASAALANEMPELSGDVLQAIARHTSAAVDMTDLDMVVYIADVIEPSRPHQAMDTLRQSIGAVSLEELFLNAFRQVFAHLINQYYMVHPDTIAVWNRYIQRARARKQEEGNS